jgi:hypothetical protein
MKRALEQTINSLKSELRASEARREFTRIHTPELVRLEEFILLSEALNLCSTE